MSVEFVSHADEVLSELERLQRAALEAAGSTCASTSRNIVTAAGRIDSDFMRGSTTHLVQGETAYIGTNAKYAIYNEVGTGVYVAGGRKSPWAYKDREGEWHWTRGMPAIHFIRDGVAKNVDKIKQIIVHILKGG